MKNYHKESRRKRNILHIKKKASWVGHVLRRKCFFKHVTEEKIEGTESDEVD